MIQFTIRSARAFHKKGTKEEMKTKLMTLVAAAAATASVFAEEEFNYTPGEGLSYGEQPIVSAEFEVKFDSKYITYGVMDGMDPIARLNGYVTFFDWWYVGAEILTDLTKGNGKRTPYGYGNRAGKLMTLDAATGIAHEFDLGETLGKLAVDFYYTYEYLPRHAGTMNDTQYHKVTNISTFNQSFSLT